jgi:hypothetical protein
MDACQILNKSISDCICFFPLYFSNPPNKKIYARKKDAWSCTILYYVDQIKKGYQIKEEQRTLRLVGGGVEAVDVVENLESQRRLELVGGRPWPWCCSCSADGRRGGARAILVATERRSAAPPAIAMPTTAAPIDLVRPRQIKSKECELG